MAFIQGVGKASIFDHGALVGLGDDDHAQYHNDSRAEDWLSGNVHTIISAATLDVGSVVNTTTSISLTGISNDIDYTVGAGGVVFGANICAYQSSIRLTNSGFLFQPNMYVINSTVDAGGGATIGTSPVSFSFTNPSSSQGFANGYLRLDVQGTTSDTVAAYTIGRTNGAGNAYGYKGYAIGAASATGNIVGVRGEGADALNSNHSAIIGVEGTIIPVGAGGTPKIREMGVRSIGHLLTANGSILICSGTSSSLIPANFTGVTGHLNFSGSSGELFVQGKSEFESEVFFDGNESGSFTAVTGAYTAGSRTYILASGTFTVTLPAAASCAGRRYTVKNTGAGSITVSGNGANIDGAGTASLASQYDKITVLSDGTQYWVV